MFAPRRPVADYLDDAAVHGLKQIHQQVGVRPPRAPALARSPSALVRATESDGPTGPAELHLGPLLTGRSSAPRVAGTWGSAAWGWPRAHLPLLPTGSCQPASCSHLRAARAPSDPAAFPPLSRRGPVLAEAWIPACASMAGPGSELTPRIWVRTSWGEKVCPFLWVSDISPSSVVQERCRVNHSPYQVTSESLVGMWVGWG